MLLFVVLINDPRFLHILLGERDFFISSVISSNQLFFVSGRLSPHHFEMFAISPHQACAFRCWFFNNSIQSFFARMLSKFICGRNCHFLLCPFIPTILLLFFCSGGIVMLLSSLIILFCQDHVLFLAYPFNRSVVSIIPHLTGVSSKCFHFAKFMFYSFHVQPECCPNSSSLILF